MSLKHNLPDLIEQIFTNIAFSPVQSSQPIFRAARLKNAFLTGNIILRVTSLINIISLFACQFPKLGQVFCWKPK